MPCQRCCSATAITGLDHWSVLGVCGGVPLQGKGEGKVWKKAAGYRLSVGMSLTERFQRGFQAPSEEGAAGKEVKVRSHCIAPSIHPSSFCSEETPSSRCFWFSCSSRSSQISATLGGMVGRLFGPQLLLLGVLQLCCTPVVGCCCCPQSLLHSCSTVGGGGRVWNHDVQASVIHVAPSLPPAG